MKKLWLLIVLLGLMTPSAYASHLLGGELRYESIGNGNYQVSLKLYRDCSGIALPTSATAILQSSSLSVSNSFTLSLQSIKSATPQCSFPTKCTSPSSLLPGFQVGEYTATVTIPNAAADWEIAFVSGARTTMSNLTASGVMYLVAKLDNTGGDNSNTYIPNMPPLIMGTSHETLPLQMIDADGDSLVIEPTSPLDGPNNPSPFATGYSFTSPFGSTFNAVYNFNQSANSLDMAVPNVGIYVAAYRIKEYRNGVLVGTSMREFATHIVTTSSNVRTFPMPFLNNPKEIILCPADTSRTISFSFIDSTFSDSVFIDLDTAGAPQNGWTYNLQTVPNTQISSGTLTVTAPSTLNPATARSFYLTLYVYDNNCPRNATEYAVLVKYQQKCPTAADTVWPGDANSDKVVNLLDPLAIALTYNETGPQRTNASTQWVGQLMLQDWAGGNIIGTSVNKKHADCNGDSTVNLSDLGAITANYGLTHPKEGPRNKTTGAPELFFDISNIDFSPGATVNVPIVLGDAATPMTDVYGVATRVAINFANSTLPTQAAINTNNSWMGNTTNTLSFNKNINVATVDWVHARIDHQNVSGNGVIGVLTFMVPSNVYIGERIDLTFGTPTLIDKDGNIIANVNVNDAAAYVDFPTNIKDMQGAGLSSMVIVPNPSANTAMLNVNAASAQTVNITITDVTGKAIWTGVEKVSAGNNQVALPASQVTAGVYMIHVNDNVTLKWVKQ